MRSVGHPRRSVVNAKTWIASFIIAIVVGIAASYQLWASYHGPNRAATFWDPRMMQPRLIPWLLWASLAPLVMLILERVDDRDATPWLRGMTYALLAIGTIVLHAAISGLALGWWWSFPSPIPMNPAWHIADLLRTRSVMSGFVFALIAAVHHARARALLETARPAIAPEALARPTGNKPIALKTGDRVVFVSAHQIDWVEADGDYVVVHAGGEKHRVRETITAMESRLPPDRLIRVSRSAIVNVAAVREMQPWFRGNFIVILRDGSRVTTGQKYRDKLTRLIQQ